MEYCKTVHLVATKPLTSHLQKEQREELSRLLKKYGNAWEPWQKELQKFKGNGEDMM
jgi:hypothetical protein